MDGFVHPLTGEILEAEEATLKAAADAADVELGRIYRALSPIRAALAEMRGPIRLPRPSRQTDVQRRICPSCGKPWEKAA